MQDLDAEALGSDTMKASFDQMRKLRGYVDANFSGRDWNLATAMVMNGEAAFQIDLAGRPTEARAVRLDSLGWARYGFGSDWAVRAKLREVGSLNPARGRFGAL